MTPVISTRLFGRVPCPSDLALARRFYFEDMVVWMDHLLAHPTQARLLCETACDRGVRFPAIHLPTAGQGQAIERLTASLDIYQRAFDEAEQFGSRLAIAHIVAKESDALWRLINLANDRDYVLAFETDVNEHSSVTELLDLLAKLERFSGCLGLCVDLSRTRLTPDQLREMGRSIRWLEVSSHRPDWRHAPPTERDTALRADVQVLSGLPYVCYEVQAAGGGHFEPGEAELTLLMRQIQAWHRGDSGRTKFEGPIVPF